MKLLEKYPETNTTDILRSLDVATPLEEVTSSVIIAATSLVMPVFLEMSRYFPDVYQIYSDGLECIVPLIHSVKVEWYLPIPKAWTAWTTVKPTCEEDRIVLLPRPIPRIHGNDAYYIGFLFHRDLKEIARLNT